MEWRLLQCQSCQWLRRVGHTLHHRSMSQARSVRVKYKQSHYEVLGLRHGASNKDIRAAFVRLCKQLHPDKNPDDPRNHDRFVRLNEAYTVLNRETTRREYDLSLAHRLRQHQAMANHMYTSHSTGGTHYPGSGTARGDGESFHERVFWDETIWYMRDRSKDAYYPEDMYYGIKGMRRKPHSYIVALCLVLVALGCVYFYLGFRWARRKRMDTLDKMDRANQKLLDQALARARELGTVQQLERLSKQWEHEAAQRARLDYEAVQRARKQAEASKAE